MSGWDETITTLVAALRDWRRWAIIRKVKRYENEADVKKEIEKRAIDRASRDVTERVQEYDSK